MRLGLLAKKVGMSRFYDSSGVNHSVTILKVDESNIVDIKTDEKNGYSAVRLSLGKSKRKINKPVKGFLKKQNISSFLFSKEFRVSETSNYKVGDKVTVSNFIEGQFVDVTSSSKGKGFAGGMKRHNFGGNRATHGVSISHRSHGSTGQCQDPGKVFKGKKMAGQLGNKRVTTQNVSIISIDNDEGLILIKGSIPGSKGGFVYIKDAIKSKLPEGLPYPAGFLENNKAHESKKVNDVTKEEDKVVSGNITNKDNNVQSLSMEQDSTDQISKNENLNENKDK